MAARAAVREQCPTAPSLRRTRFVSPSLPLSKSRLFFLGCLALVFAVRALACRRSGRRTRTEVQFRSQAPPRSRRRNRARRDATVAIRQPALQSRLARRRAYLDVNAETRQ